MAEHISLPWANEVPPESVWSTLRHKAAALKCSRRRCKLSSVFTFFFFSLQLTTDTLSNLLLFFLSSFFLFFLFFFLNQGALFSSSCHCYTLSLSWDPFDVVRHNEIPLHLGQFPVWGLILHEPISRAFQHTHKHKYRRYTHLFITEPIRLSPHQDKMKQNEYMGSHTRRHIKRTSLFCCFTMQARKEARGIMVIILQEQNNLLRWGKRTIWMCR